MRILHVISSLAPKLGGPSIAAVEMSKAVAAYGHDVAIYASDLGIQPGETISAPGVGIHLRKHLPFPNLSGQASLDLWGALKQAIPKADIVHLHSLYLFHDWAAWKLCRRHNVPYVLRPHGTLDPLLYPRHRWRKSIVESLFQDRVTRDATFIHYTSDTERDLATPFVFGRPGIVVPLGVGLDQLTDLPPPATFRMRYPEIGNRPIVLFLGRLSFKKGLDILIPAFAEAVRRSPDLHLVLAGTDDNFGNQARALVSKFGLEQRTTFTGHLDRAGVIEAYAAANLFVLPSRTENFAVAAAEAMAAGVPCILSDQVQIAGEAGNAGACRVASLDIAEWTSTILDVMSSPDATKAMTERAKVHARKTYSWKEIGALLVSMYDRAIAAPRFGHGGASAPSPSAAHSQQSAMTASIASTTAPMRILHVMSSIAPKLGGTSIAVMQMAKAVADRNHDVTVYATDLHIARNEKILPPPNVHFHLHRHLPFPGLNGQASLDLWHALNGTIPGMDVVHLHSLYLFHDWAVRNICRRHGVPYVLQPHGALHPFIHNRHRWRKTFGEHLFQNRVTRDAALVQFTSQTELDMAQPYVFGRPGVVVPLGVDLDRFAALPPPGQFRDRHLEIGNRHIVLFLGRLSYKKGLDVLIPAFAAAVLRNPTLHLVLAGADDNFGAQARSLVARHSLEAHTTFTGHLGSDEVVEAYAAADIFVLPSRTENFALAAAEAMAAGIPSILSGGVQIAEAARRQGACRVVPLDTAAWSQAILDIISSPEAAKAMGERARAHAREYFSWTNVGDRLVAMYERVIAERRRGGAHE